jgi:hypothetical protein
MSAAMGEDTQDTASHRCHSSYVSWQRIQRSVRVVVQQRYSVDMLVF